MYQSYTFSEQDAAVTNMLKTFLPNELFDVHAHIYRMQDTGTGAPNITSDPETGYSQWNQFLSRQLGRTPKGGLFFPFPSQRCDINAANTFLLEQIRDQPHSRGLLLTTPDINENTLRTNQIPLSGTTRPYTADRFWSGWNRCSLSGKPHPASV